MPRKRKPVSSRDRFDVFKRDRFTCQYCGRTPPVVVLQVDHIIPVCEGGSGDIDNLVTACEECNRGKAGIPLDQAPPVTTVGDIEQRRERARQLKEYNDFLIIERQAEDAAIRRLGHLWNNNFQKKKDAFVFGPGRVPSIRAFLRKLPETEIADAIEIAFAKYPGYIGQTEEPYRTFKYFCGICWRKIKQDRPQ